jgi:regulator of replication initiation timing
MTRLYAEMAGLRLELQTAQERIGELETENKKLRNKLDYERRRRRELEERVKEANGHD